MIKTALLVVLVLIVLVSLTINRFWFTSAYVERLSDIQHLAMASAWHLKECICNGKCHDQQGDAVPCSYVMNDFKKLAQLISDKPKELEAAFARHLVLTHEFSRAVETNGKQAEAYVEWQIQ